MFQIFSTLCKPTRSTTLRDDVVDAVFLTLLIRRRLVTQCRRLQLRFVGYPGKEGCFVSNNAVPSLALGAKIRYVLLYLKQTS
jgi:hypothetical protein